MTTDNSRNIVAPGFGVFEGRKSVQPIFVVVGLDSSYCFRQAAAYARAHSQHQQGSPTIIRRAEANLAFSEIVGFPAHSEFETPNELTALTADRPTWH